MTITTRTFTADELEDWQIAEGGSAVVHDEVVRKARWYTEHRAVFQHDGQLWAVTYRDPATEMQEDVDLYASDPVTAILMKPYEVTVTKYRPVSA